MSKVYANLATFFEELKDNLSNDFEPQFLAIMGSEYMKDAMPSEKMNIANLTGFTRSKFVEQSKPEQGIFMFSHPYAEAVNHGVRQTGVNEPLDYTWEKNKAKYEEIAKVALKKVI